MFCSKTHELPIKQQAVEFLVLMMQAHSQKLLLGGSFGENLGLFGKKPFK